MSHYTLCGFDGWWVFCHAALQSEEIVYCLKSHGGAALVFCCWAEINRGGVRSVLLWHYWEIWCLKRLPLSSRPARQHSALVDTLSLQQLQGMKMGACSIQCAASRDNNKLINTNTTTATTTTTTTTNQKVSIWMHGHAWRWHEQTVVLCAKEWKQKEGRRDEKSFIARLTLF